MSLPRNHLELLAPARDIEIGKQAVLHGADAVYIGGPEFGARTKADNSLSDIAQLVKFAHRFNSKIFVTFNTILHDSEIEIGRKMIHELWDAGVDALIVQDMGILELDIPPIQLHASTQCDIRTVEKAKFLGEVGFSQLVLAREMTLKDIVATRAAVKRDVALEFFVHGALCVAFSGNCSISHAHTGRSANRGECAQECRLPYTLKDKDGQVVAFDKHLLSMKDNDQSANMRALVDAGIRSFKIEGRYKDLRYVKNITAHYRKLLDDILKKSSGLARASDGETTFSFTPNVEKTFNRSATDYFVHGRNDDGGAIGAFDAPMHMGEVLGNVIRIDAQSFDIECAAPMANGDGLTYMHKRDVRGMQANTAQEIAPQVWRIRPQITIRECLGLTVGTQMHRNRDHVWEATLSKDSSVRKIAVDAYVAQTDDGLQMMLTDDAGHVGTAHVAIALEAAQDGARAAETIRTQAGKLGATIFAARDVTTQMHSPKFVPVSVLNNLRREAVEALEHARTDAYVRPLRAQATIPAAQFPFTTLSFLANVYNDFARTFYNKHGVTMIASAFEAHEEAGEVPLMVTKHCLRWSFNLCPKQPMVLESAGEKLTLMFDCKPCEMHVMGKMKPNILKSALPSIAPMQFYAKRPAA
jgi:23S rRNA 5-hydroxycytidine C2501 synthase